VAGDALVGVGGGVGGPDPDFTEDLGLAHESMRRPASLSYEVALFGHGEPVLQGASPAFGELAAGLG
jgi:hypothetical protein